MAGRTPRGEVERWRCGEGWEQGWETQTPGDGGANTDAHREYQAHGAEVAPGIHGRRVRDHDRNPSPQEHPNPQDKGGREGWRVVRRQKVTRTSKGLPADTPPPPRP